MEAIERTETRNGYARRSRFPDAAKLMALCGLCSLLSGCFLNALLSRIAVTSLDEKLTTQTDLLVTGGTGAICYDHSDCIYIINGQVAGSSVNFLGNSGLLGALIDPVIIQVPSAATSFSGTFTGPGGSSNLQITPVAGSLRADLATFIDPEPGTRLVIVDFPADPPVNTSYSFTFHFELPGFVASIPVKALFAAKVTSAGQTFYPPLMPCETNFANIPGVTLTHSATFQPVSVPAAVGLGCAGKAYQFAAAAAGPAPIPAIGDCGVALLAALLATLGIFSVHRR